MSYIVLPCSLAENDATPQLHGYFLLGFQFISTCFTFTSAYVDIKIVASHHSLYTWLTHATIHVGQILCHMTLVSYSFPTSSLAIL